MKAFAVVALLAACSPVAAAQGLESLRFGALAHNIKVTDGKNANKEKSPNISLQADFDSPEFLKSIGSPRPYVVASWNTSGDTSFGGVGLEWAFDITDRLTFEPGFGYVLHDGDINNPFASGTQEAVDYSRGHVLLGSRDLFRTSLSLTHDLTGPWAVQAMYEHLSHGQILGKGRNQGLDELGVRLVYQFQ